MSVSFINATYSRDNSIINKPTNTQEGDLMICAIGSYATDIPDLSGWTRINSQVSTANRKFSWFWKIATSSEPSSYNWNFSSTRWTLSIGTYRSSTGFDPSPITGYSIESPHNYDTITIPLLTVSGTNKTLIAIGMLYYTGGAFNNVPSNPTSNWTADYFNGDGNLMFNTRFLRQEWSGSGATGSMSMQYNSSGYHSGIALELKTLAPKVSGASFLLNMI